jgi:acetyltransferase-like isoleucine patch superfamily enzyme
MIIHDNGLPICIIGYENSSSVRECLNFYKSHAGDRLHITPPQSFFDAPNRQSMQYVLPFFLDENQRNQAIRICDQEQLNCPSFVDESCKLYASADKIIPRGCLLAHHVCVYEGAVISKFTVVESFCLIGHWTTLGVSNHLSPGVMIAGKTRIGDNCTFGMRATVLNNLDICDNVYVGAVSVINKSINVSGRYVGSPARKVGIL